MWALSVGVGAFLTGRRVALVGAGPGDPELMTLRAQAELAAAARVVSDAAVERLARRFAPRAEVVVVPDGPAAVRVLLDAVSKGDGPVVRLYAGDPWLHPAHGEELTGLQRAGVSTDAVAGVAVEVAVPARAGIPVNVRQLAVVCTVGPVEAVPWSVDPAHTLVISGDDGRATARQLLERGGHAVPAAILPIGGEAGEVRGVLSDLAGGSEPGVPSLLVVGAVAAPGLTGGGSHRRSAPASGSG